MEIVYKLVREEDGRLVSAFESSEYAREYGTGITTTPPEEFPQAWLFAFKTLERARYHGLSNVHRLFRAVASETREPPEHVLMPPCLPSDMDDFWNGDIPYMSIVPPLGTVLCSDITLIEEVGF